MRISKLFHVDEEIRFSYSSAQNSWKATNGSANKSVQQQTSESETMKQNDVNICCIIPTDHALVRRINRLAAAVMGRSLVIGLLVSIQKCANSAADQRYRTIGDRIETDENNVRTSETIKIGETALQINLTHYVRILQRFDNTADVEMRQLNAGNAFYEHNFRFENSVESGCDFARQIDYDLRFNTTLRSLSPNGPVSLDFDMDKHGIKFWLIHRGGN